MVENLKSSNLLVIKGVQKAITKEVIVFAFLSTLISFIFTGDFSFLGVMSSLLIAIVVSLALNAALIFILFSWHWIKSVNKDYVYLYVSKTTEGKVRLITAPLKLFDNIF
ncbi:hypothetical protein GCM10017044_05950 [Kordiimonas sediminis]|uniref:Uncharacterized protein n=1 Tax=Kordiimonas sediminis TaxID=1735581 RepID=A0A919ALL3_9PROT|nr:hypothetical protein GCM10017044_05950 [Kordiimonas sediminis]